VSAEVLHLRDFEPQRRVYGPPDTPVAVIILPVVRIERPSDVEDDAAGLVLDEGRHNLLGDA
jgi:hypothetical protein